MKRSLSGAVVAVGRARWGMGTAAMIVGGLAVAVAAGGAYGGDMRHEPIGARITLAKDRILVFTDTNARQASVAYPLASSTNPAADDFVRTPPADYDGYGLLINSDLFFNNGTSLGGFAAVGSARLDGAGTLTAAYVRLDSHDGTSRQGDKYTLRSNELFIGYSRRLREFLSVGFEVQFTDSTLKIDDMFAGVFPRHTDSSTFGVGFDVGVLVALHETVTVGLHGGVKWDRTDTDGRVLAPGPVPIDLNDTTEISEIRCGIGWRPTQRLGFYADGQFVHLEDDLGNTDIGRFYVGAEILPNKQWALRVGGVFDTQPQAGVSVGVGYYGIQGLTVELAYTYNTFPEVRHEFGRANLVSASVVLLF